MSRLLFRTRGGPTQGWGNVVRLASFAAWCHGRGHSDPVFLAEGPEEVREYLQHRGFETHLLADGASLASEQALLEGLGPVDLCVVEMLDVGLERQRLLRRYAGGLVVFDDLCDQVFDADLVVCGQSLPNHSNRLLGSPSTRYLVGPDYFLCRPEFLAQAAGPRVHRPAIGEILVTMGGGDYATGYLKAAMGIAALENQPHTTFVLGPGGLRIDDQLREILPDATVLGGVDDLPRRLWDCDVVIAGAGYTKLEAALLGTPLLLISAQWHQIPLAKCFADACGAVDLGYRSYVTPEAVTGALQELESVGAREQLAVRLQETVDGRGFERVYSAMTDLLIGA